MTAVSEGSDPDKTQAEPCRVVQIVPNYGIGGVEIAALSAARAGDASFTAVFLSGPETAESNSGIRIGGSWHALSLGATRFALGEVRRLVPDVVVCSLWKSVLVFLALRFRSRRPRLAVLLHAERTFHVFDSVAHAIMLPLADAVWSDAHRTLSLRYPETSRRKPTRVISFLTRKVEHQRRTYPEPQFIFWGRLHPLKNVRGAVDLFGRIARDQPDATLTLIGRDEGARADIETQIEALGLKSQVTFLPQMSFEEIAAYAEDASFFIQTSETEGMAMAVVEAMQLGLVVVVTPVGEIPTYAQHGRNAILVNDYETATAEVKRLLASPDIYQDLSARAVATWAGRPLYADDIREAAADLAQVEGDA